MRKLFAQFLRDQSGAAAVEYGLLLGLISVAAVAAMTVVGANLVAIFTSVGTTLTAAG